MTIMALRCSCVLVAVAVGALLQAASSVALTLDVEAGHARMRKMTTHYEVVGIDTQLHEAGVSRRRRSAGLQEKTGIFRHPESSSFVVEAFGKRMQLDLRLNSELIPSSYAYQYYKDDGALVREKSVEHCYYQGTVAGLHAGVKESYAAVSTCNGLSGVFGSRTSEATDSHHEEYFIEPLVSSPAENGTHLHAVYRPRDAVQSEREGHHSGAEHASCGGGLTPDDASSAQTDGHVSPASLMEQAKDMSRRVRRMTSTRPTLHVEFVLVLDYSMYTLFKSTPTGNLMNLAMRLVNFGGTLLEPLKITLALAGLHGFPSNASMPSYMRRGSKQQNSTIYLPQFRRWQLEVLRETSLQYDTAMFLTNTPFEMETNVGEAYLGSACNRNFSAGLVVYQEDFNRLAGVLVHEIGHNLGFTHNTASCTCAAPPFMGGCIMDTSTREGLSYRPAAWSSCSTSRLQTEYDDGNLECLKNSPTQTISSPVCGNGYLEQGEECDCGSAADCQDNCCNAATCRLAAGAVCSHGPCCHQCQYSSSTTVCRAAVAGGCDVAERCTGNTTSCPADRHMQAGILCGSGSTAGFCNLGLCRNRDLQCRRVWDKPSTRSRLSEVRSSPAEPCYRTCTDNSFRTNCTLDLCSFLSCRVLDDPQPGTFFSYDASGQRKCSYFVTGTSRSAEFVDDYTGCGAGKWCRGRKCVTGAPLSPSATVAVTRFLLPAVLLPVLLLLW